MLNLDVKNVCPEAPPRVLWGARARANLTNPLDFDFPARSWQSRASHMQMPSEIHDTTTSPNRDTADVAMEKFSQFRDRG